MIGFIVDPVVTTEHKISIRQNGEAMMQKLSVFLDGSVKITKTENIEVAKAAICLLKGTWASSDAVLEYISTLFDESVRNYTLILNQGGSITISENIATHENIIQETYNVFSELINEYDETWAPLILTWSLNLLGQLSTKHKIRRGSEPSSTGRCDPNLSHMLQLWMDCCPIRALIELTTQCLSTLIISNLNSCIDVLIETSVLHSPDFDWVVAHICSCFPKTVVSQVLVHGLKNYDFFSDKLEGVQATGKERHKIDSVVDVLGHLASHHETEMRAAIRTLFNESLYDSTTREQLMTGPFLLKIASMSDILSDIISSEFAKVITPVTLNVMFCQVQKWKVEKIPGTDGLTRIVAELLLRSDGGSRVIRRLLHIVPPSSIGIRSEIRDAAGLILDYVLLEMQRRVYRSKEGIPVFRFLKEHIVDLCSNLSEIDETKASWVFNLIKLTCIQEGEPFSIFVIGYLLGNTENVGLIASLAQQLQIPHPNTLCLAISYQMRELNLGRVENPVTLIKNITELCHLEKVQKQVQNGVGPNLEVLASLMSTQNEEYADALIELMSLSTIPEQMPIASLFKVGSAAIYYLFDLLWRNKVNPVIKFSLVNTVECLLVKLSEQSATQNMILGMLLEGVLNEKYAKLFGGKLSNLEKSNTNIADFDMLSKNGQVMSSMTLSSNHCATFHSGVIYSGLGACQKLTFLPEDEVVFNKQMVLYILQSCSKLSWRFPLDKMRDAHPTAVVSGMKVVALLLVELVSPDVMFNDPPWPDEEFQKITIERDLKIKQKFELHPILWDLLLLVATIRPSLYYCSVLLRAMMAVLMSFWESNQEKTTTNSPKQLEMTQILISIMAIGQIIPPPLSYIDEILAFVSPQEARILLSDIWQYMRDNVSNPELSSSNNPDDPQLFRNFNSDGNNYPPCEKKYIKGLSYILFENTEKFGPTYAKFFPIK